MGVGDSGGLAFPLGLSPCGGSEGVGWSVLGCTGCPPAAWDASWREVIEVGAWDAWVELLGTNVGTSKARQASGQGLQETLTGASHGPI